MFDPRASIRPWGLLLGFLASCGEDAPSRWQVRSPDGAIQVTVARHHSSPGCAAQQLCWRVRREGRVFVDWSPLGIQYGDTEFDRKLEVVEWETDALLDTYEMRLGKRRRRSVAAQTMSLSVRNPAGESLTIEFRVQNDGAAFRYRRLGVGEATVLQEHTGFFVPPASDGWMQPYDQFLGIWPAYERSINRIVAGDDVATDGLSFLDDGWGVPALFRLPPTDASPDGYLLLTEADLDADFAASRFAREVTQTLYQLRLPNPAEGNGVGTVNPVAERPWVTPWRVAILGDLGAVVESTMVDDLSRSPAPALVADADWVRPGRVAWSWWSQGTGDAALQRAYVDFAEEMGWEYVLVDAGWDRWADVEQAMPELVQYGAARGVGIILWYNSGGDHNLSFETPRDRMVDPEIRRAELSRIAGWGVVGIKVDFFVSDKQDRIQQYLGILQDAAAQNLMVSFHGCTTPRGWQRTYPNLMTMEAVQGAEFYRGGVGPTSVHNVRLAYVRNVVGSMDYTPVTLQAAWEKQGITFAQQLALPVVFESGWQHFADQADFDSSHGFRATFAAFPRVQAYLRAIPVTWDETRWLAGDPDRAIVLARRGGATWFVAAISGPIDAGAQWDLDLSFLDEEAYAYTQIQSGTDGTQLVFEDGVLSGNKTHRVVVGPQDGYVIWLWPQD